MTTAATNPREAVYQRSIAELFDGRDFARWSMPDPIARYHGGPIRARSYAKAMGVVAAFAGSSDWAADVASAIFRGVNRYATSNEFRAQIASAIRETVADGWYDVIGATGPEAGRPSSHQHATTEHQWMTLYVLHTEIEMAMAEDYTIGYVPGVGWPYARWMAENGYQVHRATFPRVAASMA